MRSSFAAAILFFLTPSLTSAQEVFNLYDMPLGGRTGPMGGAGIAQGNDEGAMWLNPAGLSRVGDTTLGLSLGAYGMSNLRVDGAFREPGLRNADQWNDDGFSSQVEIVPASLCFFLSLGPEAGRAGHQVVSAGVFRTGNTDMSLSASFRELGLEELIVEELVRVEARPTSFGLGYAIELGSGLRLGASLFATSSSARLIQQTNVDRFDHRNWGQGGSSQTQQVELQSWSLQPVIGVQWQLEPLIVGLSVRGPRGLLSATGQGHYEQLNSFGDSRGVGGVHFVREATLVDGFNDVGWLLGTGVALLIDRFVIEVDGSLYLPMSGDDVLAYQTEDLELAGGFTERRSTTLELSNQTNVTWNVAVGAELELRGWSLLGGFFTDRSTRTLADDDRFAFSIDRLGGTLGVGLGSGPVRVNLGARYSFGSGTYGAMAITRDAAGQLSFGPRHADLEEHRLMLLVSGSIEASIFGRGER